MQTKHTAVKSRKVIVSTSLPNNGGHEILKGIFNYLDDRASHWDIRILQHGDISSRSKDLQRKTTEDADGIIITDTLDARTIRSLCKSTTPLVVVGLRDKLLESRKERIAFVHNDNAGISRLAASHLLDCGKFNSYVCLPCRLPDEQYWSEERCEAFSTFIASHGRTTLVPPENVDIASWLQSIPRPIAVFAVCDSVAEGFINRCNDAGVNLSKGFAVLGVNNDEICCRHLHPQLSSIQPGHVRMGETAAHELDRLMNKRGSQQAKVLTIPPAGIVERESTRAQPPVATLVSEMVTFINENAQNGISVADVARHVHTSRRLAELRFRQFKGTSIRRAIEKRRLETACRLLSRGKNSVVAVARQCGFSSGNRLTRVFKLRYGLSIRDWQCAHRKTVLPRAIG